MRNFPVTPAGLAARFIVLSGRKLGSSRLVSEPVETQPSKRVVLVSYLDYPFPAGLARRISGFVESLLAANFPVQVISPTYRSPVESKLAYVASVDLRFLRALGAERLPAKILGLALFNLLAFVRVLVSRKETLAVQYESIYSFPAAFLAKFFCRLPCIGDDVLVPRILGRFAFFELALCSATDLALSSTQATTIKSLARTRTIYVPTGISEPFVLKRKSISFEPVKAVFVGALSYRANVLAVNHILKTSSQLPEDCRCQFLIVGGELRKDASSRVKFLGSLDDNSLLKVYNDANVGVLPFFGIRSEGPKVKLLDYMAAQLLVISSPEGVQGYPQLVAWEHYVPAASVQQLAQVLNDLPRKADFHRRIALKGHEFVIAHYQWVDLLKEYLNFMKALKRVEIGRASNRPTVSICINPVIQQASLSV